MPLPPFVDRLEGARLVVEVAAGTRFDAALALARALPSITVRVTDVDPRVRDAPQPLKAAVDDLTRPDLALYEGATFLYARRLPEELQGPALRLARSVGAPLAVQTLKDEWAEVDGFGPGRVLGGGWRLWERRGGHNDQASGRQAPGR